MFATRPYRSIAMATASLSLATALWGARFASGLLCLSYTTPGDTTLSTHHSPMAYAER